MFCPKCGNKIQGNKDFCPECGFYMVKSKEANNVPSLNTSEIPTLSQQLAQKNPWKKEFSKIKKYILNHKKILILGSTICMMLILVITLFYHFYDFTKLSWDPKEKDTSVQATEPTTLTLHVLAYDKKKNPINNIKFSVKDGKIEEDGSTVKWKLPEKAGHYTITATSPSGKTIEKTVQVVSLTNSNEHSNPLFGILELPEGDESTDTDQDGLLNIEEKEMGTNPNSMDTDRDGLSDAYEVKVSMTDPLKKDTDLDGINDGDELDLGLDPLKNDSKNDGILDGKRILSYQIENNKLGVSLEINGKGNIASTTIDVFKNESFADIDGLMDCIYNFYTSGTIESATVKIHYDLKDLQAKGLKEENLTLYYFDEEKKELEAMPTTVDQINKQIIVTLKHFSKYVIGDNQVVLTNHFSDIMFVIDNSISMYSESQMINTGSRYFTGADGNDTSFKRLTLTNKLVDMFTGNYQFGVAEFSGNYVNLHKFSDHHEEVKKAVNSMKSNWNSNCDGTNIVGALKSGIEEFTVNENNRYLILLTDGKNTEGSLSSSKETIISSAKEKEIKICVIGLGNKIDDDDLNEIAESTGCDYYNASDSSALDEIYAFIGADINYNYVDTDGDNKVDGMIQKNSGFLVNRDGFSFSNFRSNKSQGGHCYGMAAFAMLYYTNQLPLTLGPKEVSKIFLPVKLSSKGYDLNDTYFAEQKTLYDFKIKNKGLSLLLGNTPGDYRDHFENDIWMIKEDYYHELAKIGARFEIKDDQTKDQYSKYQTALLTIDQDRPSSLISKDETQVLNAIWRLYILQIKDKASFFNSDPDATWNQLSNSLEDGMPIILGINSNHAVNAIRLIQNINDANQFKIEIYDNNYPGETRYMTVTRSKFNKVQLNYTAWVNEYNYTFSYDILNDGNEKEMPVTIRSMIVE